MCKLAQSLPRSLCAMCQVSGAKYNSSNSSPQVSKSPCLPVSLPVSQSPSHYVLCVKCQVKHSQSPAHYSPSPHISKSPCHTTSPSHDVPISSYLHVPTSPCHDVSMSPSHYVLCAMFQVSGVRCQVKRSQNPQVTRSPSHHVSTSLCHHISKSQISHNKPKPSAQRSRP